MTKISRFSLWLVSLLSLLLLATVAKADSDHERARAAMEKGDVVELAIILEKVESLYEGSIIEVELEDEEDEADYDDGQYVRGFIYEIKLLTPQGNLLKLKLDARTTELIQVKGHGEKLARKGIRMPEEEQEP